MTSNLQEINQCLINEVGRVRETHFYSSSKEFRHENSNNSDKGKQQEWAGLNGFILFVKSEFGLSQLTVEQIRY